jgi:hypothetical protein
MAYYLFVPLFLRISSYAFIFLLVAWIKASDSDTGVLEVDLFFPRNKTYAPTTQFPIVFVVRNSTLAQYVDVSISYDFRNKNTTAEDWLVEGTSFGGYGSYHWANWSATTPTLQTSRTISLLTRRALRGLDGMLRTPITPHLLRACLGISPLVR